MAYTEILTTYDVTAEQWDTQIMEEYLGQVFWRFNMGPSDDACIQTKMDLTKKPGDAITINLRSKLQGGHVTGRNRGIGNEGKIDAYGQRITIDNDRQVIKFYDIPMSQQRVSWSLLQSGRSALVDAAKFQLEDDITTAMADTAAGRVRGRYLYGAVDSNWNATHATALTNVDNTADQLTTGMIDIGKRKAVLTVNATAKIRPMKVMVGQAYQEWFTFVGHTYCVRDMILNDAAWRNAQLNIPPGSNGDSVIYTGSSFKGSWNGVLVYEWDRVPLVSSTIQVGHNLLMGAQAGAVCWGQMSKFGEEFNDIGHEVSYELHEIRGIKKVVYGRNAIDSSISDEDNGVVHIFGAAVAD